MMKTSRCLQCGLILAFAAIVFAFTGAARAETLELRARAFMEDGTYQLDIVSEWRPVDYMSPAPSDDPEYQPTHPGMDLFRMLSIRCIERCKSSSSYREESFDLPISAFPLWDEGHELVTVWGSGNSYRVSVYRIEKGRIWKVLDQGTRSAPQFAIADDGSAIVVLGDRESPAPRSSFKIRGEIWKWNGKQYRAEGGPKKGLDAVEE